MQKIAGKISGPWLLHRPMRISRYDAGTELVYNVTVLETTGYARTVRLLIERFVAAVSRARLQD